MIFGEEYVLNHHITTQQKGIIRLFIIFINHNQTKYKGHPQNASIATKEVNDYIKKHELEPISPVHQLMKIDKKTKKKEQKKNEVDLEVYIKVS